ALSWPVSFARSRFLSASARACFSGERFASTDGREVFGPSPFFWGVFSDTMGVEEPPVAWSERPTFPDGTRFFESDDGWPFERPPGGGLVTWASGKPGGSRMPPAAWVNWSELDEDEFWSLVEDMRATRAA